MRAIFLLTLLTACPKDDDDSAPWKGVAWDPHHEDSACSDIDDLKGEWHYNWLPETDCDQKTFVPMIWSDYFVTEDYLSGLPDGDYLLGFNEPDIYSQANMTVEEALDLWSDLEATGKLLGSPATSFTTGGKEWLADFMAEEPQVDFMAIHWYGNCSNTDSIEEYIQYINDQYGLPIWITEFSCYNKTEEENLVFMKEVLPVLESVSEVERIAWFANRTNAEAYAGTALIDGENLTSLGEEYRDYSGD